MPLLVAEPATRPLQALAEQDPDMLVWCSQVECVSALTRIERAATLDAKAVSTSFERLKQLAENWHEVEPGGIVRGARFDFCGFIRCGQPTLYNSRLLSSQQSAVRPRCNS